MFLENPLSQFLICKVISLSFEADEITSISPYSIDQTSKEWCSRSRACRCSKEVKIGTAVTSCTSKLVVSWDGLVD